MKKMTKLLSVILAFVMALSCMTMMASAARTSYRTVSDLEKLNAYSPYGTVTRLTTEERLSIVCDALDNLLAAANINLGEKNLVIAKIKLNFTSLNNVLSSLDSFYNSKGLLGIVGGTIGKLNLDSWQKGMTREGTTHETIINEILELLSKNTSAISSILTDGLSLGLVSSFIKGLDLGPINKLVKDIPGAINAIALPMMGRPDDDANRRGQLIDKGSNLLEVAQSFVNGLFTKPMSWTSYRVDANGEDLGYTTPLPDESKGTSRYFRISDDGNTITQFDYQYAGIMGSPKGGVWVETVSYEKSKEFDTNDCKTYVFRAPEGYEGDQTLKWYKAENVVDSNGNLQSGYWLPSLKDSVGKTVTLEINGADSLLGLLYKFAPYVFAEMAPIVLNGSAKKLIAEAFDVKFDKIGVKGSDEVAAEVAAITGAAGNPGDFFTKAQEYYVWEYTDYKVITTKDADGNDVSTPYYRYQDTYFKGTLPSNLSAYYAMFNWDWKITADFMNEFIPKSTEIGSKWALDGLNNLFAKAIDEMILPTWDYKDKTYNRDGENGVVNWQKGGNDLLLTNILNAARGFFGIAPEEILDEYYADAQFYDKMMNGTLNQAVNGLVMELVKLIMPQIKFADNLIDQPITAIAAVVVRELCTQLMPSYDFDAMIFSDYEGTKSVLEAKSADYWLDTTLYMGVNLGMFYLRNIADIGEDDSTNGYYGAMANLKALPAATGDGMKFSATSQYVGAVDSKNASWLYLVDWIVDWALDVNVEWCWHFNRFVDVKDTKGNAVAVDLKTYQNPFTKISSVLLTLIPDLENLLNTGSLNGSTYGSDTFLEKILKGGLVDSIVNLKVPQLLSIVQIPANSVLRSGKIADTLVQIIVKMLNSIFYKVAGSSNIINTSTINSVNALLNQTNLKTTIVNLVGKLYAASNTYKVLDPILPIVNFFVGWTTDAQKFAQPESHFTNNGGDTFFMANAGAKLVVSNKSAGMLLKHRNSGTLDKDYIITVNSITFDMDGVTASGFPASIDPYASKDFDVTIPANKEGVARATIKYSFTGKDGKPVGGEQTKITYIYLSTIDDDEGIQGANVGVDANYAELADYQKYVFTTNLYDSVTNYNAAINGKASTGGSVQGMQFVSFTTVTAPKDKANTYFAHLVTSEASSLGGWSTVSTTAHGGASLNGRIYKAKAGVDSETFSSENSEANNLYGHYDMGGIRLKSKTRNKPVLLGASDQSSNDKMVVEVTFVYYTDYGIKSVKDQYVGYALTEKGFDATKYAAYDKALREVIKLADYPLKTDYVTTIQPQIPAAIEALEKAYKELTRNVEPSTDTDVSLVKQALAKVEPGDTDNNFQDYALFEYFKYENERTSSREMIKSVTPPSAPEKYIDSVWGDKLVEAIIASKEIQNNEVYRKGVTASVSNPSDEDRAEEMAAYEQALSDFRPASYSDVQVGDQAAKLQYYWNFMTANTRKADMNFINKEIKFAKAQGYVQDDYSKDSWKRYTEALANAEEIAGRKNAQPHEVFDAKYELMVAQNKLLEKCKSMKDNVESAADDYENIHTDRTYLSHELNELIKVGTAIVNYYSTSKYRVNPNAGVSETEALEALVRALGVRYSVTVDGKPYSGILYDYSALTFQEYDRVNTVKNKRAVDAAADKLREAIAYFECDAQVAENDPSLSIVSDNDMLLVVGFQPNAIVEEKDITEKIDLIAPAGSNYSLNISASKAGFYGTGTSLKVTDSTGNPLVSYYIVIFGDVNGDGAIDAFDALEVDLAYHDAGYHIGAIYDDAADVNHDGVIDATDYGALVESVQGTTPIPQVITAAE